MNKITLYVKSRISFFGTLVSAVKDTTDLNVLLY